jgi:uncharacterized membrane protein YjjB (DUF3815 family)
MTTFQKSKALWIGGGIVGGLVGYLASKSGSKAVASAALGSILMGAIGDVVLEQEQRTGVFSLLPLGR